MEIKKCVCAVIAICIISAFMPHATKALPLEDVTAIIGCYGSINDGSWQSTPHISSGYSEQLQLSAKTEFRGTAHGIANVISACNVRIIAQLEGSDYSCYADETENPAYYLTSVDEKTISDDGFNMTGTNYHVVICGTEEGCRRVCDMRLPLPHTVTEYVDLWSANVYFALRFGIFPTRAYSHADIPRDFDFMPTEIRVKRFHRDEKKDAEIETVDFKQYTYVVLCGEVCPPADENYPAARLEYCKAAAIAARNFGWYKYFSSGVNADFHLYDCSGASSHHHPSISPKPADQLYLPEKHGNPDTGHALAPVTIDATDAIWDVVFTNDEYKLFLSICANGKYNDDYEHMGKLRHQGSKYLAVEKGMDYKEILHYYYDYVDPDKVSTVVGNGGKVHVNPYGDVSMNETFNTVDAVWALKYAAGMLAWDDGSNMNRIRIMFADANDDGTISTTDAVLLLRRLAGME